MGASPPARSWDAALILPVVAGMAALAWSPGYSPDPDSYYHVECARLYATKGWLSSFPWLPYTALGPSFPNVHLLQHLALAPVVALLPPDVALRVAPAVLAAALVVSIFCVLRRWRVPAAGAFTALSILAAPLLIVYATSVKGAALFFVLLVWHAEAVWARSARRTFVLSWLAAYAYVGAPILLAIAAAHALVLAVWEGGAWWRLPLATAAGLAAGLLVNPFWPGHLEHTARELLSTVGAPAAFTAGVFRGGEWLPLDGHAVLWLAGAPLLGWGVVIVRQAARAQRLTVRAAAGMVAVLSLFLLALAGGSKLLQLFALTSALFLPLALADIGPWPRRAVAIAAVLAAANAAWSFSRAELVVTRSPGPRPAQYRELASWVAAHASPGEMVVAPWDDFPGLFYFDPGRRYVAGMNMEFLLRTDPVRFDAYYRLYTGRHPDPAAALRLFDGARLVVARRPGQDPAGGGLFRQLAATPAFERIDFPEAPWSVFRAR